MEIIICSYCGKEKQADSFVIGASKKPDWTLHFGTGKYSCPECFDQAKEEAAEAVKKHIEQFNQKSKEK